MCLYCVLPLESKLGDYESLGQKYKCILEAGCVLLHHRSVTVICTIARIRRNLFPDELVIIIFGTKGYIAAPLDHTLLYVHVINASDIA